MVASNFNEFIADVFADLQQQVLAEHNREIKKLKETVSRLEREKQSSDDEAKALREEIALLKGAPGSNHPASRAAPADEASAEKAIETPVPQTTRRQRAGGFSAQAKAGAPQQTLSKQTVAAKPSTSTPQRPDLPHASETPDKQHSTARANESAKDREEELDAERPFEAEHGFAGALFGEALQNSLGENEANDLLVKLGKAVPPPPPNASFRVGQKCEAIGTIMRTGESLDSSKIMRLEPGTRVEVLEIGSGPTGKRIRVMTPTGMAGWISVISAEGVSLLTPLQEEGAVGFIGDLIGSLATDEEDLPAGKKREEAGPAASSIESLNDMMARLDTETAGPAPGASSAKPKRKSAFDRYAK